jgi:uncharacterized protein (DUF2252 family)
MPKSLIKRLKKFNADRDPEMVKLKYEALKESPFRFFRGTCHLFYEDLPEKSFILHSPKTWICGDLHLENFGTFKGNNRVAYFDMNDFDESFLGPCLLDVVRLCTSVFLASGLVKIEKADCRKLVKALLHSYASNLEAGHIRYMEHRTAKGFVKDMLDHAMQRQRIDMLKQRVVFSKSGLAIKHDELKAFAAREETKHVVKNALGAWAKEHSNNPGFYKVIDIANRATGTGSIGIERHLVLVNGKGKPDGYYLLDIKEAVVPSAFEFLKFKQPKWKNEAERLIGIQGRVQAASPAYFNSIQAGKKWFVMKELQPLEDKVDFNLLQKDTEKFTQLLTDMGAIIAWNNLRAGGRQGSAIADELIKFGRNLHKQEDEIVNYAEAYASKIEKYWQEFKSEEV